VARGVIEPGLKRYLRRRGSHCLFKHLASQLLAGRYRRVVEQASRLSRLTSLSQTRPAQCHVGQRVGAEIEGHAGDPPGSAVVLPPCLIEQLLAGDTLLWVEPEQTWETPELDPGRSVACDTVAARLQQARELQGHVLLLGPTGTGKSYVARELAAAWGGPLVAVNCAAMPESLLESELFGHEAGAFTGAVKSRRGLFEAADGGTLFLDEIGEMSSALQAKLLTAIETGEIRPVGATATRCVQVRIIAATNTGVSGRHHGGTLREDLYHRLAGSVVEFAPLRRRVPLVAQRVAESLGVGPAHLTPEALESLLLWVWPGNYRELTNELQRLKSVSTRPLDYVHLSEPLRQVMEQRATQEQAYQQGALPQAQLAAALEQSNGNVSAAAESLKLHRTQFRRWAKGYGLI
jgi:transcriptional regulator with GAF, ATPase, and Fis domain